MYNSLIRVLSISLGTFVRCAAIKNEFLVTLVFLGIGLSMCMGLSLTDVASAGMIEYRSIDGTNNNLFHPDWGSTETPLWRVGNAYADGLSIPAGITWPSARKISNIVVAQNESILNDKRASDFIWQWGQFIDHDIDPSTTSIPEATK